MWIFESNNEARFIFEKLEPDYTKDRYLGRMIIDFEDPEEWKPGTQVEPMKVYCRKLEDWEIVKYKLQYNLSMNVEKPLDETN